MANIVFAPICSNCGLPIYIDVDIDFKDLYGKLSSEYKMVRRAQINPSACPNCGEHFESIKMPTRLPYKFSDDVKKIYDSLSVVQHNFFYLDGCKRLFTNYSDEKRHRL